MSLTIVEWQGPSPKAIATAVAALIGGQGARVVRHYVSRHGGRGASIFEGTLEGVEALVADVPLGRVGPWEADLVGDEPLPEPPVPFVTVVVQRSHAEPTDRADQRARRQKAAFCLELYGVTPRSSFIRVDGLRQLCIFEAPDVEAVRIVNRKMGEPLEDAWSAFVA